MDVTIQVEDDEPDFIVWRACSPEELVIVM
jgi:hypothetical protein